MASINRCLCDPLWEVAHLVGDHQRWPSRGRGDRASGAAARAFYASENQALDPKTVPRIVCTTKGIETEFPLGRLGTGVAAVPAQERELDDLWTNANPVQQVTPLAFARETCSQEHRSPGQSRGGRSGLVSSVELGLRL